MLSSGTLHMASPLPRTARLPTVSPDSSPRRRSEEKTSSRSFCPSLRASSTEHLLPTYALLALRAPPRHNVTLCLRLRLEKPDMAMMCAFWMSV
jgi:hypothetical protein